MRNILWRKSKTNWTISHYFNRKLISKTLLCKLNCNNLKYPYKAPIISGSENRDTSNCYKSWDSWNNHKRECFLCWQKKRRKWQDVEIPISVPKTKVTRVMCNGEESLSANAVSNTTTRSRFLITKIDITAPHKHLLVLSSSILSSLKRAFIFKKQYISFNLMCCLFTTLN